ncbi:MAG: hypothetical protein KDB61_06570, partial [Planctomycetes bacterium]|nr:hypothetical protein [Planctomycetota bacterium]
VAADMEFKDGSKRTISAELPATVAPQAQAVGSARFWGWYQDKPYWLQTYRMLGAAWKDHQDATWVNGDLNDWPDFEFHRVIAQPEEQSFSITYRDKSEVKLGPYKVQLDAPTSKELTLHVHRNWENPRSSEIAFDEYLYRLEGPIQWLDQVLEVDYKTQYLSGERVINNTWHETSRWSLDGDGFRGLNFTHKMLSVEATVTFRDGREPLVLNWKAE